MPRTAFSTAAGRRPRDWPAARLTCWPRPRRPGQACCAAAVRAGSRGIRSSPGVNRRPGSSRTPGSIRWSASRIWGSGTAWTRRSCGTSWWPASHSPGPGMRRGRPARAPGPAPLRASSAAVPGDAERVSAAVQRAGCGLGRARRSDHGDLVVGERRDRAGCRALRRTRAGEADAAKIGERFDAGRTARRLGDPLGAAVRGARVGLRGAEAVRRVRGIGDRQRVAVTTTGHRGGDVVAGTDVVDYLDIILRIDLPPVVVVHGALVGLDERAILLNRAAAVAVDAHPERGERRRPPAAGYPRRLGPAGGH